MVIKSPYPQPPPVPDANIHHCLFNTSEQDKVPDYVVNIEALTGRKRTFYEFRELVYDGATALASPVALGGLGLDPSRDIVSIYSHNCMDFPVLGNACLAMTLPISLPSAYSTPFELTHALRTSGATCIFADASMLPQALAAAKEVGIADSAVHILEGQGGGRRNLQQMIDSVRRNRLERVAVKQATKQTLAYLVFSSGTTGLPKAVKATHGNIWATALAAATGRATDAKYSKAPPPNKIPIVLLFLPFYAAFGIHASTLRPFSIPSTVVILPRWNIDVVLRTIARYRITALPLAPSMVHQLVNHPDIGRTDLSSLEALTIGAAYLPPSLLQALLQHAKNVRSVFEGYGTSEMTVGVCRTFPPGCFGKTVPKGSLGVLYPGIEAKVVRQDGTEAMTDEPGELWVRGETMSPGYFRNAKATKEAFVDGWMRTGDTVKFDKDGFFYYIDRAKDTLKVGGSQVSPTEIEEVLRAQPDGLITDVSVAGVSGGRTSDEKIPRAWVVLSAAGKQRGADATLRILDEWAKKNLSRYKWLRGGFEVVDEIPKNPTGKVIRRALQDRYEKRNSTVGAKL